ncbi:TPA: branched-chain amino acid transport system II carrier protein, partial [Streptococcus pyogenes]|nr:branched-chain amino acid transport system II carrier protein [Streptococcus pyogenes]
AQKCFNNDPIVYRTTIGLTFIPAIFDALLTLSQMTGLFHLPEAVVTFFQKTVPLGQFSMGWIIFAAIGFLIGLILSKTKKS